MAHSKKWTGLAAGVAALALAGGVVGAVGALSDDGDAGDDTVVVAGIEAGIEAGDGETKVDTTDTTDTTDATEHDMDDMVDMVDMDHTAGDATDDTGHTGHDEGSTDDTGHDGHDDGNTGATDGTGHDGHGGGTTDPDPDPDPDPTPDPCDDGGGHNHSARAVDNCPDPDPDPDSDPDPDPCEGHVHTADASDPCNPDPCEDTGHEHGVAAATDDCVPDPCEGHVHNDNPDDPCNPDPCDDGGGHVGHGAATATQEECPDDKVIQYADLAPEVQAMVDLGTNVAIQYPTTADASGAGWAESTIYFPGIAAHYLHSGWLDSNFEPSKPEVLLYGKDGQLVGLNYIVFNAGGPPDGFPGDVDQWHEHPSLCMSKTTGLVIGGENLSVAECDAIGGFVIDFQNFWLLHVWTIPGYESPEGVFSHANSTV